MLVVPWTTLFPSLLALIVLLSWWLSDPKSLHLNLIATLGCLVSACTLAPDLTRQVFTNLRSYFAASGSSAFRFENVVFNNASMIVTGAALVWCVRFDSLASSYSPCIPRYPTLRGPQVSERQLTVILSSQAATESRSDPVEACP